VGDASEIEWMYTFSHCFPSRSFTNNIIPVSIPYLLWFYLKQGRTVPLNWLSLANVVIYGSLYIIIGLWESSRETRLLQRQKHRQRDREISETETEERKY